MTLASRPLPNTRSSFFEKVRADYALAFPVSRDRAENGDRRLLAGSSHPGRFVGPFSPMIAQATKSCIKTVDGVSLIDFWQGHFTNVLGHDPEVARLAMFDAINSGRALQLGVKTSEEERLAAVLCNALPAEAIRFTTSGTLATMYAIGMGLVATGRSLVAKAEGAWHGGHHLSLKGVRYPQGIHKNVLESAGLPESTDAAVRTFRFNDPQSLQDLFVKEGHRIGVLIIELVLGNSGMVVASREFVRAAREISRTYGAILIVDEIVTAFRVGPGGMSNDYGIEPDLITLGKVVGGGMPLAAIAGRREILSVATRQPMLRSYAEGGTFSAHPLALATGLAVTTDLVANAATIYPGIAARSQRLRAGVRAAYTRAGVLVHVTGDSEPGIPTFPIGTVRFVMDENGYDPLNPISHWDGKHTDITLRDEISRLAMMMRGIYPWQGLGCIVHSHTEDDVNRFIDATSDFARDLAFAT